MGKGLVYQCRASRASRHGVRPEGFLEVVAASLLLVLGLNLSSLRPQFSQASHDRDDNRQQVGLSVDEGLKEGRQESEARKCTLPVSFRICNRSDYQLS
jgi:hypothetical protein